MSRAPRCAVALVLLAGPWLGGAAHAASASSGNGSLPRTAAVNLDFRINIDKFIFFRLGDAAWLGLSAGVSTVAFTLTPSIPSAPTVPVTGNNTGVPWNGGAPTFTVAATGAVLPVQVRSNAGQATLRATVSAALTSGANTIPMTEILVSSSDGANLPAPPIPASGTGATVNVAGGGPGTVNGLVTNRSANWTFSYANSASYPAGTYSGQLTFTASTP